MTIFANNNFSKFYLFSGLVFIKGSMISFWMFSSNWASSFCCLHESSENL